MKRTASFAAVAAAALALAACDNATNSAQTGSAQPPSPIAAAPAPDAATAPKGSPQVRLEADMELSTKVKGALPAPGVSQIEVAANDGVVTLYGTVDTSADKDRVAIAALGVEGVRSVVNNLVVLRTS